MTTNRVIHSKGKETIEWTKDNGEFGTINIEYNGHGGFNIDAEYIGLEAVYCIIQHAYKICE